VNKIIILLFVFITACAGAGYTNNESTDHFDATICDDLPVGIGKYEYLDPTEKAHKISCADLERCTTHLSWSSISEIPCED